ncbi:MAG: hypothetical protein GY913_05880 [Proteobacteria bacterium]|nr:hypothetical protein [Pseudomonadota bacterium]
MVPHDDLVRGLRAEPAQLGLVALAFVATVLVFRLVPERLRKGALGTSSGVLLALVVGPDLALFLAGFAVVLQTALCRLPERWRVGGGVGLLVLVLLPGTLSRVFFDYSDGLDGQDLLSTMVVTIYCRKAVRLVYEVHIDKVREPAFLDVFIYLLGLPFLLGRAPVVSFAEMWSGWNATPELRWRDAGKLAWSASHLLARLGLTLALPHLMLTERFVWSTDATWQMWAAMDLYYLRLFLFRIGQEQTSIAMSRFFGFDLRDNYENPLAARSYAEVWRRWNIHFRELLLALFYYPVLLRLHRRAPRQKLRNVAIATAATFFGHWLFILHSHWLRVPVDDAQGHVDMVVALAVYDLLQTTLVIAALALPRFLPSWLRGRSVLGMALGIALTFQLRAFALVFFQGGVNLSIDGMMQALRLAIGVG